MKLTSEIIQKNLNRLEIAKKEFPILSNYMELYESSFLSSTNQLGIVDRYSYIKNECLSYGLKTYVEFIEFIVKSKVNGQEIFYKGRIKNSKFQEVLVRNAKDYDAKKTFKSKDKKSFTTLINSKKWDFLNGKLRPRRSNVLKYFSNNIIDSEAIIANYCIQNEIEIDIIHRVSKWYWFLIPEPDTSIKDEIERTKEIINFIIDRLSDSSSDFRKINLDDFIKTINYEMRNRMLSIDPGEKIRCIETSSDINGITLNGIYDVHQKMIGDGILKVQILNDFNRLEYYNYRFFETITNIRNKTLDNILNSL